MAKWAHPLKGAGAMESPSMNEAGGVEGLTAFQIACESKVLTTLREAGLAAKREIQWIGEPAILLTADVLHIWIYVDEAGISRPVDWRYEKWDYKSPDDLITHLVTELQVLLTMLAKNRSDASHIRRPRR